MTRKPKFGDIMRAITDQAGERPEPGQTCLDILKFDSQFGGEGYVCQLGHNHGGPHMRTGEVGGRAWGIVWT